MDIKKIIESADRFENEAVEIRRDFHKYAESAWTEFRTTAKIIEFLQERGIQVLYGLDVVDPEYCFSYPDKDTIEYHKKRAIEQGANPEIVEKMQGYTGAMAIIDSGKPGKTIAMRFDIDCNDLDEAKDEKHKPYRENFASVNDGCMHACGHDGHATIGMLTAAILNEYKDQLTGKVKIVFQLGEEGVKGALSMVKKGILDDADFIYAAHISAPGTEGTPSICAAQKGSFATTKIDITINGKSSHAGGDPEKGNHAILAACTAIMSMYSQIQSGKGNTRLNVGTIQGGTGRNVIPEKCFFRVETRGSNTEAEQDVYDAVLRCVDAACRAYGCTWSHEIKGRAVTAEFDEPLIHAIMKAAELVPEFKNISESINLHGGADDFAYMVRRVQEVGGMGCYMALQTEEAAGHHNSYFDFDEKCLIPGVKQFLAVTGYIMEHGVEE